MTDKPAARPTDAVIRRDGPDEPAGAAPAARRGRFISTLREPGLRRFSSGTIAWGTAHQMVTVSQGYVLYQMTESTLWLAALGAAVGVPNMAAAIIGGVLSDRFQRKHLLMAGSAIVAFPMLTIAILYSLELLQPWHLLLAGVAQGVSLALDWISRLSLLPSMVSRRVIVSAIALDQSAFNAARVAGPLGAGAILGAAGPGASYAVIAGLFATAVLIYTTFRPIREQDTKTHGRVISELAEAARLLRSESILGLNVLFTAINAMMLGGFVYLIPAYADRVFDTNETGVGLIFAATGTGAFLGALSLAWRGGMDSAGKGLLASNLLFAGAAVLYTLTGDVWTASGAAFLFGYFNAIHVSLGVSAIQVNVPEQIRGRVLGAYELAWSSFPLGGLVLGALASGVGLKAAVMIAAAAVALITVSVFLASGRMRSLKLNP
jgi:MFS family permease